MGGLLILWMFLVVPSAWATEANSPRTDPKLSDDRYLQILNRVESIEKRDREQQAEIKLLRSELNAEKRRTSRLEDIISRLKEDRGGSAEKEADAVGNTVPVVGTENHDDEPITARNVVTGRVTGGRASKVRRQAGVPVVAFDASLTHHQQHTNHDQSILFDNVITNLGAAYNPKIGAFIAPVPGVYVFSTTILGSSNYALHCQIVRNNALIVRLYMRDHESTYGTDSATVVLHLNKGDEVAVHNEDTDKFIHGDHYSMFSGFLLRADEPTTLAVVGK